MDRRDFIQLSALAGGGLILSLSSKAASLVGSLTPDENMASELGDFLKLTPSGDILFQLTKHEMGQGISTGLAMILAEELCADWQKVKIEIADVSLKRYQNQAHGGYGTGGSTTTLDMWRILRNAGATIRQLLINTAASEWNTRPENCRAENHVVINMQTNAKFNFGELASKAALLPLPENAILKNSNDFTIVGKPKSGKLIPAIITGNQKYGIDVKVEGMFYAVIARCPVYRGKLKSFDATQTLQVAGVKKVVTTQSIAGVKGHFLYDIREGVAVVADSFWAAKKGRQVLKVVWDEGNNSLKNSEGFEKIVEEKGNIRTDPTGFIGDDNAMSDLTKVKKTIRATYIYPHQLHSFMEPLNCTAHFKGNVIEIWTGTQAPDFLIGDASNFFEIDQDKIEAHLFPSGGGFGRRWYPDAAMEAICISKEAGNVPIKLIWTREDDQQTNMVHCYVHNNYQAGISTNNELVTWYHKELRSYTWGSKVVDPELTWIGYDIPNIRYDFENLLEDSLLQSCAWRAVVANAWAFGQECFIDEIASALKKDPYEYRMTLLKEGRNADVGHGYPVSNNRLMNVLKLAAEKSQWGKKMSAGQGIGIAAYPYMHGNSYCAMVAEVRVIDKKLIIDKITCAVDCGVVVNPSSVKNQIEGGVVWALTALFYGGVNIHKGKAVNSNFHQNKIARMKECPSVEVHFVQTEEIFPCGIGELAPPPTIPAVVNAIFSATGNRIRKLPLQTEEL